MKYRKLSSSGDYTFGHGLKDFYSNQPEAVAQAIQTRLLLMTGEWFLDVTDGTPYNDQILNKAGQFKADLAIRTRILNTPGLKTIERYFSFVTKNRQLFVEAEVNTIYGTTTISQGVF